MKLSNELTLKHCGTLQKMKRYVKIKNVMLYFYEKRCVRVQERHKESRRKLVPSLDANHEHTSPVDI